MTTEQVARRWQVTQLLHRQLRALRDNDRDEAHRIDVELALLGYPSPDDDRVLIGTDHGSN